jgi:hypothetical protein
MSLSNPNMWRVRLGETASAGKLSEREIFEMCRQENPPCVAVGWGEVNLSQSMEDIECDFDQEYDVPFAADKKAKAQIEHWHNIKQNDIVFVATVGKKLCAIGKVIRKRYVEDENFDFNIIGGSGYSKSNPKGVCSFYNRLDVEWIVDTSESIPIESITNSSDLLRTLLHQHTIVPIKRSCVIDALTLIYNAVNYHKRMV